MRWFKRSGDGGRRRGDGPTKADVEAATAHLRDFVATRVGVEMYVEPQTSVTPPTLVLVATTGEWTRRRVGTPAAAWDVGRELGIPVYDVQQTGYPARMREWTSRRRREGAG